MSADAKEVERPWIFTFGSGSWMADRYVRIVGTYESARVEMVRRYDLAWAFQDESEAEAGVAEYSLRETR